MLLLVIESGSLATKLRALTVELCALCALLVDSPGSLGTGSKSKFYELFQDSFSKGLRM